MTDSVPPDPSRRYDRHLARGALFNALGLLAKLLEPAFILFATWMFGPAVMGVYLLAIYLAEVVSGAAIAGYVDATTIFASRHVDRAAEDPEQEEEVYRILANAFVLSVFGTTLLAVGAHFFAAPLVHTYFEEHQALIPGIYFMGWALVPLSLSQVSIAATKAHMRMEYDAAISAVRPVALLGTSIVAWQLDGGAAGLMASFLIAQSITALASLLPLARHFELRRILSSILRFRFHREMLSFAIPQNLNLTFNRYITRLDVIMLAAMEFDPVMVAWYATASMLTSNLRQIRLVFSGALAPVAARHHSLGEREALQATLGRLSRWTTTLIVPAVLATIVLRDDILRFVSEAYVGDSRFIAVLLIPPFTSCAFGLAGNCIIYTGHTRWTLANSFAVAILNTFLNLALIPVYGLLGAAVATAIATSLVTLLQLVELRFLERVTIRFRDVYKPHLGLLAGLLVVAAAWDPTSLPSLAQRAGLATFVVLASLAVMVLLRHEELSSMLFKRARAKR